MSATTDTTALERQLDAVMATLLAESGASRTTLRIDDEARGWRTPLVCAEAVRPGVRAMRGDGSINPRAAATAQWMLANRRMLIQPDVFAGPTPPPPPELTTGYATRAQMVAPLFNAGGELQGYISVHYAGTCEAFTPEQIGALQRAEAEVRRLTGI